MTPQQQTEINKLIAFVCTCKRHNTPDWMAHLADRLNAAILATGCDSRVIWPGKWANEFHLEIDGADLKARDA